MNRAGDANRDEVVNISDAVAILSYVNNNEKYTLTAQGLINSDVNQTGDGLSNMDALDVQKYLVGTLELESMDTVYYYAIDAVYNNGVTETVNEGFIGDAYVNIDNTTESDITWVLDVETSGNYLITFKVANGSTDDRQMKIEVNGASDYWVQSFLTTDSWTNWEERGIVLPLTAGINVIKLTSLISGGGPNFDYIRYELTEEPVAETYVPEETTLVVENENPVIYIAGDSTVQSYRSSYAPQQGWGYYLADYFTENVTVSNQAIAGRSSKSFYDNGRLDTILSTIKEGDYLLVQFGINDSASSNAERYAPVCGDAENPTEGSFEYYIEKYIMGALEKGATPVMVTMVIGIKTYSNGQFANSYTTYCQAMKDMAELYDIPCIDLNSLMVDHYNSIGYDAAYYYHLISTDLSDTDMTHFTETGANAVAGLVANAIRELDIPLSQYVK